MPRESAWNTTRPRELAAELEEDRERLVDALADLYEVTNLPSAKDVGSPLWTARHRARLALEWVKK